MTDFKTIRDTDYDTDINHALLSREERQEYYGMLYQAVGEIWMYAPDPWPTRTNPIDFAQDIPGEWHMYNALHQGLHTLMDTLAALVDITEEDASS